MYGVKLHSAFVLVAAHLPFLLAFLRSLWKKELPSSISFVGISALVYFDTEVVLEALGWKYVNPYFASFFSASDRDLAIALGAIASAPWLMLLGYVLIRQVATKRPPRSLFRGKSFFLLAMAPTFSIAWLGLSLLLSAAAIWQVRSQLGEALGPYVIILSLPLAVLSFYLSTSKPRKWLIALLIACSVVATLPMGERTSALIPFLIVAIFYGRPSIRRFGIFASILVIGAAAMIPMFKFNSQDEDITADLLASIVSDDVARAPVLIGSLDQSQAFGTTIMRYPGEGYVYSALFFVPRSLVPFKGNSTAITFTARRMGEGVSDIDWGFGISAIDEAILNFGWLLLPLCMLLYGVGFGLIDHFSERIPVLAIPGRLSALWIFGYHLPAIIQLFGPIAILGVTFHWILLKKAADRAQPVAGTELPLDAANNCGAPA